MPAGVVSITIVATGAQGGLGFGALGGAGGLGGRTTATVSVTPGASLTVRVGGVGPMVLCVCDGRWFQRRRRKHRQTVAGAVVPRVCVMAPPRSWSPAAEGAGALKRHGCSDGGERRRRRWSQRRCWPNRAGAVAVAGEARRPLAAPGAPSHGAQRHQRNRWRGGSGWNRWRHRRRIHWWRRWGRGLLRRRRWRRWIASDGRRRGRRGRLVVHGARRDGCRA